MYCTHNCMATDIIKVGVKDVSWVLLPTYTFMWKCSLQMTDTLHVHMVGASSLRTPHTHTIISSGQLFGGPGGGGFGCTTSKARPCILTNHSFQQLIQHTKRPTVNTWTQRKKKHLIMFTYTFSSCNLLRYTDLEWLLFFSFFQFAHFNYNIEHAISTTCLAVPN